MTALLAALVLSTEPPQVSLHHSPGAGCAGQSWLEGNVTARLGFSPFVAESQFAVSTYAECTASACQARLEVFAPGKPPRRRTLTGPANECNELMESLALALALAIDPQLLSRPPAAPDTPPPAPPTDPRLDAGQPPSTSAAQPPLPVEAPAPKASQVHFQGGVAGHASAGLSPYPTGGATIGIGFRIAWFGLLAEGRFDAPQSVRIQRSGQATGLVSSSALLGSLIPCGHFKGFGMCLLATAGALQVTGDLQDGLRQSSPLLLLGGRLLYEWMFWPWLGLHAHVSLLGVVTRTTVLADDAPVWITSQLAGELALGVVVVF